MRIFAKGIGDIFKKGFLDTASNEAITFNTIITAIMITLVLALVIFIVYKMTFSGTVYSHTYNVSLVIVSLITCLIVITIGSNLVLSLGMVGALSIVRFRTTIKDPFDMVFMFFAITLGIMTGAGAYLVAILGTIIILIVLVCLMFVKTTFHKYMLVIIHHVDAAEAVNTQLAKYKYVTKTKGITKKMVELTLDLKYSKDIDDLVNELGNLENVEQVTLINYSE